MNKLICCVALFLSCTHVTYLRKEHLYLPESVGYKILSIDTLVNQRYFYYDSSGNYKKSDTMYKVTYKRSKK